MKKSAFQLFDPVPELRHTHAFSTIRPWIDEGDIGSMTLYELCNFFNAEKLGCIRRPDKFFDFTRYRPLLILDNEGKRKLVLPNTYVHYAKHPNRDYLFLDCLEPHHSAEDYIDSIVELVERFDVERYCVLGSVVDQHQPRTRPLRVSGTADRENTRRALEKLNIRESGYQGPTTILIRVSDEARKRGIETMGMIVHLPCYLQTDKNYSGQHVLLKLLSSLYGFSIGLSEIEKKGVEMYRGVDEAARVNPGLREFIKHMENVYDSQIENLSPEVEKFMKDVSKGFGQN